MASTMRVILAASLLTVVSAQFPKWFTAEAKDMYGALDDLKTESKKSVHGPEACDQRAKLMKTLGPVTGPEKSQIMLQIIGDLAYCELAKGNAMACKRRSDSAIAESNANDDQLMANTQTAPVVIMRDACKFIANDDVSKGAVELRRARTIWGRERLKMSKNVAKQVGGGQKYSDEQLPAVIDRVFETFKEGGQNAAQMKQIVGAINSIDANIDVIEKKLIELDEKLVGGDALIKKKNQRLKTSSGPFLPGLLMDAVVDFSDVKAASGLKEKFDVIKEEVKAANLEVSTMLLKRTKDGKGCDNLPKTCEAVKAQPDIATNGFGETRVLVLKKGNLPLDMCDTNGNLLVLLAIDGDVKVKNGDSEPTALEPGTPVVVDHCLVLSLQAEGAATLLVSQAWHPEMSNIERTTEIRDRATTKWGLKAEDVKEITAQVNAYGKKGWGEAAKQWQAGNCATKLRERLEAEDTVRRNAEKAIRDEEEAKERSSDTDRQAALDELEKKRQEKKEGLDKKAAEKARLTAKARAEEEAKKDPWLRTPEVKAAEALLQELKESRRDANSKLEFDLTQDLTKQINEQERTIEKVIKKAKKGYKKSGGKADSAVDAKAASAETLKADAKAEYDKLEKELAELKVKKAKAAEDEDYGEAKKLKATQTVLEKRMASAKTRAEL